MTRLRALALWLGRALIAWASPLDVAPYAYRSLSDTQAAELRQLFVPKSDWLDRLCPTCHAPWSEHRCPYTMSGTRTARACDVCGVGLPVDAVRTHGGHWRCKEHKVNHA